MKWLWIGGLLLFLVLAAGAWWAASQPGFWIGMAGAIITAAVPVLKKIPLGKGEGLKKMMHRIKVRGDH